MPALPIYQVDAFTQKQFGGNPAAIVPLESWLPDETMQAIALENNLAETAYFVCRPDGSYDLRWFTPEIEIPLCGHATLAAAYVLYEYLGFSGEEIRFHSKSGELLVRKDGNRLALDFPARPLVLLSGDDEQRLAALLEDALGKRPREVFHSVNNYFAVYGSAADIRSIKPNFLKIENILTAVPGTIGVIVTATNDAVPYDCVSRYFCTGGGVPEDPVTGSAHCSIVPYWAEKLGKASIYAYQASVRGGELFCEYRKGAVSGDRVIMAGYVAPYLEGIIRI